MSREISYLEFTKFSLAVGLVAILHFLKIYIFRPVTGNLFMELIIFLSLIYVSIIIIIPLLYRKYSHLVDPDKKEKNALRQFNLFTNDSINKHKLIKMSVVILVIMILFEYSFVYLKINCDSYFWKKCIFNILFY